jgi:thiamine-phosphate pyrophosphorylase
MPCCGGESTVNAPFLPDWRFMRPGMASRQEAHRRRPVPRLYLVTETVDDGQVVAPSLPEALTAVDIAAVLLRLPADLEPGLIRRVEAVARPVQASGAALILDGYPDLAAKSVADGAHLTGVDILKAEIGRLKPAWIAGAGGLKTRHDAMLAAEIGADYVMFGEPSADGPNPTFAAVLERITWWSEVFEVPCVGFANALDEVGPLAQAGADFIALGEFVWKDGDGPAAVVREAARHLRLVELV